MPKVHAHEGCSVASVKGDYGFFGAGTTPFGPLTAVGIATFDGDVSVAARQTTRRNGATIGTDLFSPAVAGPYEVDPDLNGQIAYAH